MLTAKERKTITELTKLVKELPAEDVAKLYWLAQGIHFAHTQNGQSENTNCAV